MEQSFVVRVKKEGAMFILTVPWDVRAIWAALTVTTRVYVVFLLLITGVTVYISCQAIFCIGRLRESFSTDEVTSGRSPSKIQKRVESLRQLHLLSFFLFGMVFTNELFALVRGLKHSSMSLSAAIDVCEPILALGFVVLGVISSLHIFQWIVATVAGIRHSSVEHLSSVETDPFGHSR
jgi:hypothetical protein